MKYESLVNNVYGCLTVIGTEPKFKDGRTDWLCKCGLCDREFYVNAYSLKKGNYTSCGCRPKKNLTGKVYGNLTVLEFAKINGVPRWKCFCKCCQDRSSIVYAKAGELNRGKTWHCGCERRRAGLDYEHLAGRQYGRWTVIGTEPEKDGKRLRWLCRCECKTEKLVDIARLQKGVSTSCGCYAKEMSSERLKKDNHQTTHGDAHTTEYIAWCSMKARCYNTNLPAYKDYGAKGVIVCAEWLNSYPTFLAYVGRRPPDKTSIDRIDTTGNYEPGNVRWSTAKEQARNRRYNHMLTVGGKTQCLGAWAEETGLRLGLIWKRLTQQKWSPEQSIMPVAIKRV